MKKPILVTGSHRSGSTWVGKVLSQSPDVFYIHEPFNIGINRKVFPFQYWFEHIGNATDPLLQKKALDYIESFYGLRSDWLLKNGSRIRSIKDGGKYFRNILYRLSCRPLIKDPIAIMSVEWLYEKTDCDVIIIIRHPAAFIASLKVKNWVHDFTHFEQQESLLNKYLFPYKEQIIDFVNTEHDIIEQGILLWNTIYSTVLQYYQKYEKQWCFVKHEDISMNPMDSFESICNEVNIKFTEHHKAFIRKTTSDRNGEGTLVRNSKSNIYSWKDRLTSGEIEKIKENTAHVWKHFYEESDWQTVEEILIPLVK